MIYSDLGNKNFWFHAHAQRVKNDRGMSMSLFFPKSVNRNHLFRLGKQKFSVSRARKESKMTVAREHVIVFSQV
jgi:hypothetical protein